MSMPSLYNCEFCGREILRIEKDVYFRVKGWSRVTVKGKLDGSTVLHDFVGGVSCRDCIEVKQGKHDEPEALF